MTVTWKRLTFIPTQDSLDELRENWGWLVDSELEPFLFASSGDVFFQAPDKGVHWLDTGRGILECVAGSRDAFLEEMREDGGRKWLLRDVIEDLLAAGFSLGPDQCFGYKTFPIMGGDYTPDNMAPMSAGAWYGFSGYLQEQLKDLPDGTQVQLSVTE